MFGLLMMPAEGLHRLPEKTQLVTQGWNVYRDTSSTVVRGYSFIN